MCQVDRIESIGASYEVALFGFQINSALIPDGHWRQMVVTAVG